MILLDNKKCYKRISTCFWFLLATLPFWLVSLISILSVFIHTDSVSFTLSDLNTYKNSFVSSWWFNFSSINTDYLSKLLPSWILDPFTDVLNNFGIVQYQVLAISLAWFVWSYFIELLVDFVAWLPKLIHSFMERWLVD